MKMTFWPGKPGSLHLDDTDADTEDSGWAAVLGTDRLPERRFYRGNTNGNGD